MSRGGNTSIDLHGGDLKLPCLIVPRPARPNTGRSADRADRILILVLFDLP